VIDNCHCSRRATGVTAGEKDRRVTQHRELRPPALATAGIRARRAMFTSRVSTGFFIHRREPPRASLAILPGRLSLSGGRDRWRPSPVGPLVRSFHFQATNHRPHAGGSDAASIRMLRSPGQSSWSGVDGVIRSVFGSNVTPVRHCIAAAASHCCVLYRILNRSLNPCLQDGRPLMTHLLRVAWNGCLDAGYLGTGLTHSGRPCLPGDRKRSIC